MACWNTVVEKRENGILVRSGDRSNSYFGKFWVARITGTDPKWGLSREFINDKSGAFLKEDGFYQVHRTCQWAKRSEEYFMQVVNGNYKVVTKEEVVSTF